MPGEGIALRRLTGGQKSTFGTPQRWRSCARGVLHSRIVAFAAERAEVIHPMSVP